MTPEEISLLRLRKELEAELQALERLESELRQIPESCESVPSYVTRAKASIFHDFYSAAERIFLRIAREVDGGRPPENSGTETYFSK